MPVRVIPDPGDIRRFKKALAEVVSTVEQPEAMLRDIAARAAYPAVVDIFDNEGYGAWAGLTPAYATWKMDHFGELPILERTGNLRASLTLSNSPESSSTFDQDGSLVVGSNIPYFGAVNDIRPIAQFQEQHFDAMVSVATEYIGDVAAEEGFKVIES